MVYLDVTGRCGNQFFQYAFARKIQLLTNNVGLSINFYNVDRWKKKTNDISFCEELDKFNVVNYISRIEETRDIEKYGSNKQKRIFAKYHIFRSLSSRLHNPFFAKWYQKIMQRNGIYKEDEYFGFYKLPKKGIMDIFIKGYFEDYKYYIGLEELLKKEFSPKETIHSSFVDYIKGNSSVCLSIRVWNEIQNDKDLLKSREVCSKEYYQKAIEEIKERVSNPLFIVFSNNPEFVKENLDFGNNVIYEPKGLTTPQKVLCMSLCEHFILSTSTFSWWIQYLGKKDGSLVVSPNKWYNDKGDNRLIDKSWIKIEVE